MILSANKANRLFWLGRYAERGYLMLHLMRRAYDEVIDVHEGEVPYSDFLKKMDVYVDSKMTTTSQMMLQIYDINTATSLRSIVERMMDNAIVLRSEIFSESFSYIDLCRNLIDGKSQIKAMNISELQPITDWLLAFWGCVRERVHGDTYALMEIGRLVEHLDMNVRFDYKFYRLDESWNMIKKYMVTQPDLFDKLQATALETLLTNEKAYNAFDADYKNRILTALNQLVMV